MYHDDIKATAALALCIFFLLLLVQLAAPSMTTAALGAGVVLGVVLTQVRRFGHVHSRLSILEHLRRDADSGIIARLFDLVFIDGPPAARPDGPGREGALYALFAHIRPGALLVMDDRYRPGERSAVEHWIETYGSAVHAELLKLKNGLWVVEKRADGAC